MSHHFTSLSLTVNVLTLNLSIQSRTVQASRIDTAATKLSRRFVQLRDPNRVDPLVIRVCYGKIKPGVF